MSKEKNSPSTINSHTYILLPLDDIVVLPGFPQAVKLDDHVNKETIKKAEFLKEPVYVAYVDATAGKSIRKSDMPSYGVICEISHMLQMPGNPTLAFIKPECRAKFIKLEKNEDSYTVEAKPLPPIKEPGQPDDVQSMMFQRVEELFDHLLNFMPDQEKNRAKGMIAEAADSKVAKLYGMAYLTPLDAEDKLKILRASTFDSLLSTVARVFDETSQKIALQAFIHNKTHEEISRQQKETFLRFQIKNMQEELGDNEISEEISELSNKAKGKKWDKTAEQHFQKELKKLERMNPNNPEYSIQHSYLENLLELPWRNYRNSNISLKNVEKILHRDHYGLEKVKERIIEHMAVLKLRKDLKAPIICLYGPPGVGKTSIGKSVAEATGREYARISLGGLHDEAEIRGHRRTYIGAMPGRFIQALLKCSTGNPLILLDEIDKVGKDYKGDPSSALLEVLDPEQNKAFHDNYIDTDYDLSRILFIATANDLSGIPAPLRDRMEILEMTGYIPAEKREIALRHLVEKSLSENGLGKNEITFTPEAIDHVIRFYTREAGVRQLEKKIGKILRKIARKKVSEEDYPKVITPSMIESFLGKEEYMPDDYENNEYAGVATGLAWTPVGGDILFIETSLSPGKGEKLTLTGNLGDVMKESAMIALQYLKANASKFGIPYDDFSKYDIHIHVPEGAVPKDGPSAGITLTVSMASAFLGKKVKDHTAMTGEMTLRGKVLPVGGIKEKIIAARQGGIKTIILSEKNRKDIEEILPEYLEGLSFIYAATFEDVFKSAITDEIAKYRCKD